MVACSPALSPPAGFSLFSFPWRSQCLLIGKPTSKLEVPRLTLPLLCGHGLAWMRHGKVPCLICLPMVSSSPPEGALSGQPDHAQSFPSCTCTSLLFRLLPAHPLSPPTAVRLDLLNRNWWTQSPLPLSPMPPSAWLFLGLLYFPVGFTCRPWSPHPSST